MAMKYIKADKTYARSKVFDILYGCIGIDGNYYIPDTSYVMSLYRRIVYNAWLLKYIKTDPTLTYYDRNNAFDILYGCIDVNYIPDASYVPVYTRSYQMIWDMVYGEDGVFPY